jgi:hypothetical protein
MRRKYFNPAYFACLVSLLFFSCKNNGQSVKKSGEKEGATNTEIKPLDTVAYNKILKQLANGDTVSFSRSDIALLSYRCILWKFIFQEDGHLR